MYGEEKANSGFLEGSVKERATWKTMRRWEDNTKKIKRIEALPRCNWLRKGTNNRSCKNGNWN
jgi:hypothetical protein